MVVVCLMILVMRVIITGTSTSSNISMTITTSTVVGRLLFRITLKEADGWVDCNPCACFGSPRTGPVQGRESSSCSSAALVLLAGSPAALELQNWLL